MIFKNDIITHIKNNNIGLIPVKGISMEPVLLDGDLIFVKSYQDYSIGDIVVFNYPNEGYLVHRIVGIEKGAIICKGDNSKRKEIIIQRQILGKVIDHLPKRLQ